MPPCPLFNNSNFAYPGYYMLEFLRPIVNFDIWLYIGLGFVALLFLRLIWLAHRDYGRSIFTLEREKATTQMTRAFMGLLVVIGLMIGVYYLSMVTPTILPPSQSSPTPTTPLILPDTPTPYPLPTTPAPTATTVPTPTPLFVAEETPTPPPPPPDTGQPANCPHPGSTITQPGNGAQVAGVIEIRGSASIEQFDYYKFEFRVPGQNEWSFIERYNNAVDSGVLGSWNSDTVPPGEYQFRLVVVDQMGNYPEPCVIRLVVQ